MVVLADTVEVVELHTEKERRVEKVRDCLRMRQSVLTTHLVSTIVLPAISRTSMRTILRIGRSSILTRLIVSLFERLLKDEFPS